jgi:hypothetical protein
MNLHWTLIAACLAATPTFADTPKPNTLTPQEIADGWILLFDGETTFGWLRTQGEIKAIDGELRLAGSPNAEINFGTVFGDCEIDLSYRVEVVEGTLPRIRIWSSRSGVNWDVGADNTDKGIHRLRARIENGKLQELNAAGQAKDNATAIGVGAVQLSAATSKSVLCLRDMKVKPLRLESLFNGKDLSGWTRFTADEKRAKSKFTVTPEGWLNVKDGPGDLQTEKQFADFIFQGECISNGKHLNSGIFFRCWPSQYQQGYEMQIRNQWEGDDRTKPVDYGTGAIYRRQKARKVVSTDGEWFTMTLIAHGRHMATWINGYQTVDWTDPRPVNENARDGCKLGAGPLSIQGHDPTTDLTFRNLRGGELKKE